MKYFLVKCVVYLISLFVICAIGYVPASDFYSSGRFLEFYLKEDRFTFILLAGWILVLCLDVLISLQMKKIKKLR